MEFNKVAQFLQGIEEEVKERAGQTNGKETLKNSLLGAKVSVELLYLRPSVKAKFDAPGQNEVMLPPTTWLSSRETKVRRAILKKLKVMYGVANPYEGLVQRSEEEEEEEVTMDCEWYMTLCQIYTVIIFCNKVTYVHIWTRIGYFRWGVVVGKGVFYLYLASLCQLYAVWTNWIVICRGIGFGVQKYFIKMKHW